MNRALLHGCCFLMLCLLLPVVARADDPSVPTDSTVSTGPCVCAASMAAGQQVRATIKQLEEAERKYITQDFSDFETWIVNDFFTNDVEPAMQSMAASLTAAGMEQVAIFGSFLDAKQQLEAQTTLQSLMADAHQRYQTSTDMCAIGTVAIGMGAADRNGEVVAQDMARHAQNRQLGSFNTASSDGPAADRASRLATYKVRNCDPGDNNGGFVYNTDSTGKAAGICAQNIPAEGQNRDIDYTQTIEAVQSLNLNFDGQSYNDQDLANGQPSTVNSAADDADVVALASNLFGHSVFTLQSPAVLKTQAVQEPYLDARSVIAKRSVAENSFFAIAGMKSAGSETSEKTAPYIQAVFQQLGVSPAEAAQLIGVRPSYYSLLDAMSRRLYQSPQFFTNLYDTPANVERKDVAMQAIGLLLDRDQYKSELRSEADLAVLLELELGPAAQRVQSRITGLTQQ